MKSTLLLSEADSATCHQATSDQVTFDQVTSDQVTSDQATSDQATSDQATSDQATSDLTTSNGAATRRSAVLLATTLLASFSLLIGGRTLGAQADGGTDLRSQQAVSAQNVNRLLAELDQLFDRADIERYVDRFEADQPGVVAMFGRHLRRLARKGATRSSRIIAGPRTIGSRTVARVRHVIRWPETAGKRPELVEDSYLAVRSNGTDTPVPTFAIEMPRDVKCVKGDKFRCPPCNYEIGGVDGFLCVPLRRERARALEAASFYLIGSDVVCDIEVQIDALIPSEMNKQAAGSRRAARDVALDLAGALRKLDAQASVGMPEAWLPPMHADAPPKGLDAARLAVDLPKDGDGARAVFHVVTLGGLRHILLLRGSERSIAAHRERIDALFQSYMLLDDCADSEMTSQPMLAHTGGRIEGSTYVNQRYDVELRGPESWRVEHRIGGSMFRVCWTSPSGSRMWLLGQRVPAGLDAWTTKLADRWLRHHCRKNNLQIKPAASANVDSWQPLATALANAAPTGFSRTLTLEPKLSSGAAPDSKAAEQLGKPSARWLHLQVYDDVLLIADGYGNTADEEQALRSALQRLARR